jgi:hypothetical protein
LQMRHGKLLITATRYTEPEKRIKCIKTPNSLYLQK